VCHGDKVTVAQEETISSVIFVLTYFIVLVAVFEIFFSFSFSFH